MGAFKDSGHFWWMQCENCGMAWFVGDKPEDGEDTEETCASCLSESAEVTSLKESRAEMVAALLHVSKASVNERVFNYETDEVDDMQAIVRAALRKAGVLP